MVEGFPCRTVGKKQLSLAMRDEVVNRIGLEVVKNRDSDSAVCNRSEGSYRPLGTIAAT